MSPLARRCSPTSSHFFRSADPYTRWPVTSVGMYVTKYKQPQAANIQSTWRLAEAEFIIINRNNIKLFHFTISGDRKIVFLNLYFTYLFGSRCSSGKWTLSRDNISKIQLSLAGLIVLCETKRNEMVLCEMVLCETVLLQLAEAMVQHYTECYTLWTKSELMFKRLRNKVSNLKWNCSHLLA